MDELDMLAAAFLTVGFAAGYATRYFQSRHLRRRLVLATRLLQAHGFTDQP